MFSYLSINKNYTIKLILKQNFKQDSRSELVSNFRLAMAFQSHPAQLFFEQMHVSSSKVHILYYTVTVISKTYPETNNYCISSLRLTGIIIFE